MTRTGNTGIVITNVDGVFHNNFFKIKYDKKIITKEYLINFLRLPHTKRQILIKAGTSTIPDLNHDDFYSINIVIPPLPEQEAIAEALSDADALTESLEQLIAKKRQIKQGAMQELLTGKKRLPGFSGEWEVKQIQDISDVDPESLGSDTRPEYAFKYISLEEVDRGTLKGWTEQVFAIAPSRARRKIRKGDVLVSTEDLTCNRIA